MASELVSVVIPTYNRAHCIADSIYSVLNQTYCDLELIIVDDGSTDNTEEVVRAIEDDRVRYVRQENAGACVARNRGVDLSRGNIVAFNDSDDLWLPSKLQKQVDKLHVEHADFCYCRMNSYKQEDQRGDMKLVHTIPNKGLHDSDLTLEKLMVRNFISTQMLVGYRDVFLKERFDALMPRLQDWDLALRLFGQFRPAFEPSVLVRQNIGNDSLSTNVGAYCIALERLQEKNSLYLSSNKDVHAEMLLNSAMILAGDSYEDARRMYLQSFKLRKSMLTLAHLVHTKLLWTCR